MASIGGSMRHLKGLMPCATIRPAVHAAAAAAVDDDSDADPAPEPGIRKSRVAYQGVPGAFCEEATTKALPGWEEVPCKGFETALQVATTRIALLVVIVHQQQTDEAGSNLMVLLVQCRP